MTFIDSNIPMYLVGADHPNRERARTLLADLVLRGEVLVSDAEVLQEILHRYVAIRRLEAIEPASDVLFELADEVYDVQAHDIVEAREVVARYPELSARDAVHVAVMQRAKVTRILSFDQGFDAVAGVERLA